MLMQEARWLNNTYSLSLIRDFEYELINLYAIVVYEARWGAYLGNC